MKQGSDSIPAVFVLPTSSDQGFSSPACAEAVHGGFAAAASTPRSQLLMPQQSNPPFPTGAGVRSGLLGLEMDV